MKRFCFALDLKDDASLISEYKEYHKNVWPEITESIKNSGIEKLEIYHVANRLFMIIDAKDNFSIKLKQQMDMLNPKVQEWELLMWKYQKALPMAELGEKWMLMDHIFKLD